jgi:hypothetical protein
MLGQYWDSGIPSQLYSLQYFGFKRAIGGHANDGPEMALWAELDDPVDFMRLLNALIEAYPYAPNCGIRRRGNVLEIGIYEYQYFDYDFLFAMEIEKLLEWFTFQLVSAPTQYSPSEHTRFQGIKRREIDSERFQHRHFGYQSHPSKFYQSDYLTLCANIVNRKPAQTQQLLEEVKKLARTCAFQILWAYKMSFQGVDFLQIQATNGRLGIAFTPMHCSDLRGFSLGIDEIFSRYDLVSEHEYHIQTASESRSYNLDLRREIMRLIGDIDQGFEV